MGGQAGQVSHWPTGAHTWSGTSRHGRVLEFLNMKWTRTRLIHGPRIASISGTGIRSRE
ncbi:hypothetical protein BC826DRAFT_1031670 [Russula brevipes]|nr:hypothetical protein BC826DRAFT_1031670 [Russula brevipes]